MPFAFRIACEPPLLIARFAGSHRMVSWSLNRPGFVSADTVAWIEVRNADLAPEVDAARWLDGRLKDAGLAKAVGMMTARTVAMHHHACARVDKVQAECLVTAGLNNAERVGRRFAPGTPSQAGTINLLCHVSAPLTDAALLEAMSLASQARTVAVLEAGFTREGCDLPVSGTGTDCIVMCAPLAPDPERFAGMHTAIGEAVGQAVLSATRDAVETWLAERV